MNFLGAIFFLVFLSLPGRAHNIKLVKSKSPDLVTNGIEGAINNEFNLEDSDTFLEGQVGIYKSNNSLDGSTAENRMLGFQAMTAGYFSLGLSTNLYENSYEELKTRTLGVELGKKFFYGQDSEEGFKPNFDLKIRVEKMNLEQSKTFVRRKFEFTLEQTSSGLSLHLAPVYWFEFGVSTSRNRYNEDISTLKDRLSRYELISSLLSNIQNTLDSLSETSHSVSLRFTLASWLDTTIIRTFSEDLISDTRYIVDSIDVGFYYFPNVYLFLASGQQYSSIDYNKHSFTDFTIQINF